jgi:hypothetical protein
LIVKNQIYHKYSLPTCPFKALPSSPKAFHQSLAAQWQIESLEEGPMKLINDLINIYINYSLHKN